MICLKSLSIFLVLYIHSTSACTEFIVGCKDKAVVVGRTMEFAQNPPWKVVSAPVGTKLKADLPQDSCENIKPMEWKSIYKVLYLIAHTDEIEDASNLWLDGQNDAGLSVGALYFSGYAYYPKAVPTEKCGNAISQLRLVNYILSKYSTVKEVKKALDEDRFPFVWSRSSRIGPDENGKYVDYTFPVHWSIADNSGDAIVVEYTEKEGRRVFINEVGVFTNNPTYDWHTTNLNSYIHLQKKEREEKTYSRDGHNYTLRPFGHGSGLLGVPGDFTPPNRFIRTAAMLRFSKDAENANDGALKAWHIINSVDITAGAIAEGMTCWSVVKDLKNNIMYYRGIDFIGIRKIHLDQTSNSKSEAVILDDTFDASVEDYTNKMKDYPEPSEKVEL